MHSDNINNDETALQTMRADLDAYLQRRDQEREAAAQQLAENRARLLATLQDLAVQGIAAAYEGYGDEGNVHSVKATPDEVMLDCDLEEEIKDFVWELAYSLDPEFETNEGGDGEVNWDIDADSISVTHNKHHLETETSEFEGL